MALHGHHKPKSVKKTKPRPAPKPKKAGKKK